VRKKHYSFGRFYFHTGPEGERRGTTSSGEGMLLGAMTTPGNRDRMAGNLLRNVLLFLSVRGPQILFYKK
jgi:hypothetical protein